MGKEAPGNNAPARVLETSVLKNSDKKGLWEIIEHRVAYFCNPEWWSCHLEALAEGSKENLIRFFAQNDSKTKKFNGSVCQGIITNVNFSQKHEKYS